jgi:hypothetical protein
MTGTVSILPRFAGVLHGHNLLRHRPRASRRRLTASRLVVITSVGCVAVHSPGLLHPSHFSWLWRPAPRASHLSLAGLSRVHARPVRLPVRLRHESTSVGRRRGHPGLQRVRRNEPHSTSLEALESYHTGCILVSTRLCARLAFSLSVGSPLVYPAAAPSVTPEDSNVQFASMATRGQQENHDGASCARCRCRPLVVRAGPPSRGVACRLGSSIVKTASPRCRPFRGGRRPMSGTLGR